MRRYWESEFKENNNNLAYWTQKISKLPTISVGSVGLDSDFTDMTAPAEVSGIEKVIEDISSSKYDLVAVGRALLADHEWALKMEEGRLSEIKPYTSNTLKEFY
jgi:2,4-dienoyl-CoA reductase-like NADH-dependent reductase (Old Yellow Enzyme family)